MTTFVKSAGAVMLASVSVVGFFALTKSANLSNDTHDKVASCRDSDGRTYEEGTIREDGKTCRNGRWT